MYDVQFLNIWHNIVGSWRDDFIVSHVWITCQNHDQFTHDQLLICCVFFSRFHQISFVFTNGWVFYWVTLSSIYRMVLVFVIFSFCSFLFLLYEMIAKAWHKMPLAKSKLLVKVCQQNAIRFQFAFFFCPWHLDWIVCIAHFYLFIITVRISATPAKAWLYANIPTTNDFEFIYFNE